MDTKQFEGGRERDRGTSNIDLRFGYGAVSCMCAKASDFSGFRARTLCRNQDESDRSADSRLVRPRSDGSDEISMYSWVSSAYLLLMDPKLCGHAMDR